MSRIGNNPISIPNGVEIQIEGQSVFVSGGKGKLEMVIRPEIKINKEGDKIVVKTREQDKISRSLHGLTRSLINNMVIGVSEGFTKKLEMVGVGYRAQGGGDSLTLNIGLSHPVIMKAPEGIIFTVEDNTKISISGTDKILVGQIAANVRAVKPPEVYKGKGIRYTGEYVRRKPGKAGKVVGGAK